METGLLWFDDDPRRQLEEKVLHAAAHYRHKYGQTPTLCFVHPNALSDNGDGNGKHNPPRSQPPSRGRLPGDENGNTQHDIKKVAGIEIRTGRAILLHHFWLGVAEKPKTQMELTP